LFALLHLGNIPDRTLAAGRVSAPLAVRRHTASVPAERTILNHRAVAVGEQSGYRLLPGPDHRSASGDSGGVAKRFEHKGSAGHLRRAVRLFATQNAPSGGDVSE